MVGLLFVISLFVILIGLSVAVFDYDTRKGNKEEYGPFPGIEHNKGRTSLEPQPVDYTELLRDPKAPKCCPVCKRPLKTVFYYEETGRDMSGWLYPYREYSFSCPRCGARSCVSYFEGA